MNESKLRIRVYNVGVGDCIYVRVPHPDPAKASVRSSSRKARLPVSRAACAAVFPASIRLLSHSRPTSKSAYHGLGASSSPTAGSNPE